MTKLMGFMFLIFVLGCEGSGPDPEIIRLKTLSQECINICPRGVKKFEIEYSKSKCECQP